MISTKPKVTCPDTLCPSHADRVLSRDADEYPNRWNAVWAEATPIPAVVEVDSELTASAVPMGDDQPDRQHPNHDGGKPERHNIIVLFFGNLLLVIGMIATFGLELGGSIVYLLAAGFDWIAKKLQEAGGLLVFLYLISVIIVFSLLLADTMILVCGVVLQEALALATLFLCFLVGGPSAALEWHQTVRRSCHLFRWAFRGFHDEWACQRDLLPRAISSTPPRHTHQAQPQQLEEQQGLRSDGGPGPATQAPKPLPTAPAAGGSTIVLGAEDILEITDPSQLYKS